MGYLLMADYNILTIIDDPDFLEPFNHIMELKYQPYGSGSNHYSKTYKGKPEKLLAEARIHLRSELLGEPNTSKMEGRTWGGVRRSILLPAVSRYIALKEGREPEIIYRNWANKEAPKQIIYGKQK